VFLTLYRSFDNEENRIESDHETKNQKKGYRKESATSEIKNFMVISSTIKPERTRLTKASQEKK